MQIVYPVSMLPISHLFSISDPAATSDLLTYLHTKSILLATHVVFNLHTLITIVWFGLVSWDGAEDQIKSLVHNRQAWRYTPIL